MNVIFITEGYTANEFKFCKWTNSNPGQNFNSFSDALAHCNTDPSCKAFYAIQGDTVWGSCPADSTEIGVSGYTLYKKGNCNESELMLGVLIKRR